MHIAVLIMQLYAHNLYILWTATIYHTGETHMPLTKTDKILCGIIVALMAALVPAVLLLSNAALPDALLVILSSCVVGIFICIPLLLLFAIISWISRSGKKKSAGE